MADCISPPFFLLAFCLLSYFPYHFLIQLTQMTYYPPDFESASTKNSFPPKEIIWASPLSLDRWNKEVSREN
jgi:hypothetical protein